MGLASEHTRTRSIQNLKNLGSPPFYVLLKYVKNALQIQDRIQISGYFINSFKTSDVHLPLDQEQLDEHPNAPLFSPHLI